LQRYGAAFLKARAAQRARERIETAARKAALAQIKFRNARLAFKRDHPEEYKACKAALPKGSWVTPGKVTAKRDQTKPRSTPESVMDVSWARLSKYQHDPADRGHETEHDLEQHICGDQQDGHSEQLLAGL